MSVIKAFPISDCIGSIKLNICSLGTLRSALLAIVAMLFLAPHAQADRGMQALRKGDYETALQIWIPIAEQGSARAQYNISVLYEKGLGVRRDEARAIEWLERAAKSGSRSARDRLSDREAQERLRAAKERASHGNAAAMMEVANLYNDGKTLTRNMAKAHLWFSKAKAAGHPVAANALMRLEDSMTRMEIVKARKAAAALDTDAVEQVAYRAHGTPD